jgi:biopolymer transport protein ExbD
VPFSTAGSGALRTEINITPMIDILLALIIVFMVVVSMSQEKGAEGGNPAAGKQYADRACSAEHCDPA